MNKKIPVNSRCPCGSGKKYKRCCGSPLNQPYLLPSRAAISNGQILFHAYSDESGNSGNNLFDQNQPYFWTGTLVADSDLNTEATSLHRACLDLTGCKELHGQVLGLSGIEKIARKLEKFFSRRNIKFYFTCLEKRHLAATKFVDTLMDSGLNKAVSNLHYGVRLLRLSLAVQLIQLLDDDDRIQFWRVYESADAEGFRQILSRVREKLKFLRSQDIYHARTEQLLTDAIDWGLQYPEPLLRGTRSKLDSPNIVAFSLLVSMFHRLHQETGGRVATFIHDEQNEFAKFLKQSYELLRGFAFDENSAISIMTDIKRVPTFSCELQIAKSSDCIGLQLADVVLWLTKRFTEMDGQIRGGCRDLALFIAQSGFISRFTLRSMQIEVLQMWQQLQKKDLSEEQLEKGRHFQDELEAARIRRMMEPPDPD